MHFSHFLSTCLALVGSLLLPRNRLVLLVVSGTPIPPPASSLSTVRFLFVLLHVNSRRRSLRLDFTHVRVHFSACA